MANYRGQDGLLILGGQLVGTALTKQTYATSVSEIAITGGGSTLTGLVAVGDIFTIASGTSYTVNGSFYACTGNAIATLGFAPVVATAIASNVTVTFESHSVAELRDWSFDSAIEMIEDTVKGDKHKTFQGGVAGHTGRATAWLDAADTYQAALLDKIATATPDGTVASLVFNVTTGKMFYGAAVLSGFTTGSPENGLVPVTFTFQITGQLYKEWH